MAKKKHDGIKMSKEAEKLFKEKLFKEVMFDFFEEEREEEGPFDYDEELGEDVIAWYPEDFDLKAEGDEPILREGMKQWQWLLDGEDGPDEDTVLARDEDRHWVLAPKSECYRKNNEWIYEEKD